MTPFVWQEHIRQTHQNMGALQSPQSNTSITAGQSHRCTCASMTLPYWPKVRSSVRSVVSHDSPPTKIRPTLSSAISGQTNQNPLAAACTANHQPNPIRKPKFRIDPRSATGRIASRQHEAGGGAAAYLARRPRDCWGRCARV